MAYAHDVVALGRGASQTGTADAHDAPGAPATLVADASW